METEDLILIGGIAVGGYFVYKTLAKPISDVAGGTADLFVHGTEAVGSWLDLLNINKDWQLLNHALGGIVAPIQQSSALKKENQNLKNENAKIKTNVYVNSWLKITPSNTQNVDKQTASQAIKMASNPFIKNVSVPLGNGILVNKKPVSLPPSLLGIVVGKY